MTSFLDWTQYIHRIPLVKIGARYSYNVARDLIRLSRKEPVLLTQLGSQTLDVDDIRIASDWLNCRDNWFDETWVTNYERAFASWNGSRHAFSFMSGRVALSACVHALGLQPSDEVILPGYTCVVVPNAFHFAGVTTVYSDIELDTYGIDVMHVESKITQRTRVILLHHLYGLVCRDYEAILELAKRHGLRVIEDCAHATGAEFHGRKVGTRGDVAFYSSEQSKIFNTVQGGMAVSNDDRLAQRLRDYQEAAPYPPEERVDKLLHSLILNFYESKDPQRWWRAEWMRQRYGHKRQASTTKEEEQGVRPLHYGQKMPSPLAAVGMNQLLKIDSYNSQRRKTARRWAQWCDERGYSKPLELSGSVPVYVRYPVLVEPEKKSNGQWAARELGVSLGRWFVSHLHPVQRVVTGCPNADIAVKQCINFPTLMEGEKLVPEMDK